MAGKILNYLPKLNGGLRLIPTFSAYYFSEIFPYTILCQLIMFGHMMFQTLKTLNILRTTRALSVSKIKKNFNKLYGSFLWIGFNCLKARATSRRQFTFTTKFPEIPGTHFTDL